MDSICVDDLFTNNEIHEMINICILVTVRPWSIKRFVSALLMDIVCLSVCQFRDSKKKTVLRRSK